MAELALDDVQGHALAAELDHVRVTQLVRQGAPAATGAMQAARVERSVWSALGGVMA